MVFGLQGDVAAAERFAGALFHFGGHIVVQVGGEALALP